MSIFFKGMSVTETISSLGAGSSAVGAFSKLLKGTVIFVTSLCPSVRPSVRQHGTTRLPQ